MNKRKIRILFFAGNYLPEKNGGAFRAANFVSQAPAWLNFEVLTIFPTFPFGSTKKLFRVLWNEKYKNTKIWRIGTYQPASDNKIERLIHYTSLGFSYIWAALLLPKHDFIMVTTPPPFVIPGVLIRKYLFKERLIVDIRDLFTEVAVKSNIIASSNPFYFLMNKLQELIFKDAEILSTLTDTVGEYVIHHGANPAKTITIPNGIDAEILNRKEKQAGSPSIPMSDLIYVGNISDVVHFDCILKYLSKHPNLTLAICGSGNKEQTLRKKVEKFQIENQILFHGKVKKEKIPLYLEKARIGVALFEESSGVDYTLPTKVLEYLALDKPFLASGSREIERFIEIHDDAGIYIQNSVESFSNAMKEVQKLIEIKGKRIEISKQFLRTKLNKKFYDKLKSIL